MPTKYEKMMNRRGLILGLAVLVLIGAISAVIFMGQNDTTMNSESGLERALRQVTILHVISQQHAAVVSGFAQVHPRWQSILTAPVGGNLIFVAPEFQSGAIVTAGQVLAIVDTTAWLANLSEAENRLAQAEFLLLRENLEGDEAQRNWKESGFDGEPSSSLVLRKPQINAAKQELMAAITARNWAILQLANATITTPFNGLISKRFVSHGETIIQGDQVARVASTDAFEIALPLSLGKWDQLPAPLIGQVATVRATDGSGMWQARVVRLGSQINPETRMRTLYLEILNPLQAQPPLLPGLFVEVQLTGRNMDHVLSLPEESLTRSGQVWFVDQENRLRNFQAEVLFTGSGRVFVATPKIAGTESTQWRLARFPLESYMDGQIVNPVTRTNGGH